MIDTKTAKMLLDVAIKARHGAYAPYSHFLVGAALLCEDGEIISGANVENASYGAGICAERNAIFSAVAKGKKRFTAIAIVGGRSDGEPSEEVYPCGICRQVMAEFFTPDASVIVGYGDNVKVCRFSEILPHAFTADSL